MAMFKTAKNQEKEKKTTPGLEDLTTQPCLSSLDIT